MYCILASINTTIHTLKHPHPAHMEPDQTGSELIDPGWCAAHYLQGLWWRILMLKICGLCLMLVERKHCRAWAHRSEQNTSWLTELLRHCIRIGLTILLTFSHKYTEKQTHKLVFLLNVEQDLHLLPKLFVLRFCVSTTAFYTGV